MINVGNEILYKLTLTYYSLKPKRVVFYIGSQTPVNGWVGYHLKEAIKGEAPDYCIDFPKAVFSRGELMISLIKELLFSGGMLHIEWDNVQESL